MTFLSYILNASSKFGLLVTYVPLDMALHTPGQLGMNVGLCFVSEIKA